MSKFLLLTGLILGGGFLLCRAEMEGEEEFTDLGFEGRSIRFFCDPNYWTPHCPMVCRLFPQFCQPESTTTEAPTTPVAPTEAPTTTTPLPICTQPFSCSGQVFGVPIPDPWDCTYCYICSPVGFAPFSCGGGRQPGSDQCTNLCSNEQPTPPPTDVPTTPPPPTDAPSTPAPPPRPEFCITSCTGLPDGNYPSVTPYGCVGYASCTNGVISYTYCVSNGEYTFFDYSSSSCVTNPDAPCYNCDSPPAGWTTWVTTEAPTTTITPPTEPTSSSTIPPPTDGSTTTEFTTPTETPLPRPDFCITSCTGLPDGNYPTAYEFGCYGYTNCDNGVFTLHYCYSEGTMHIFDYTSSSCTTAEDAPCYDCSSPPLPWTSPTEAPTTTIPPPTEAPSTSAPETPPPCEIFDVQEESKGVVSSCVQCGTDGACCTDGKNMQPVAGCNSPIVLCFECVEPPPPTTTTELPSTTTPAPEPSSTFAQQVIDCFAPFSCAGVTTELAQNPWSCHQFRGCSNGEQVTLTQELCPPPSVDWSWDAETSTCHYAPDCTNTCSNEEPTEVVECPPITNPLVDCSVGFSCVGKDNTFYPDPNSCHDFRRCQCGAEVTVAEGDCPSVMTFNADTGRCVFSQTCTDTCGTTTEKAGRWNVTKDPLL